MRRLLALLGPLLLSAPAGAQPAEAPVPEALHADGVPPIPAELVDDVRRYTEARPAGFVDWHPTERTMLIRTRFGNTSQLHRVDAPMGARSQVTFFDEPAGAASYEPRAGRFAVVSRDVGGNEFGQLYRLSMEDGRAILLTDGGRSQNGGVNWNTAGDRIAYGSTRRNGADRDIYVMDPRDPGTDRLVMEVAGGGWGVADWSPDDRRLLVSERVSVASSHYWLVDAATGERTRLTPEGDGVSYSSGEFAPDGRSIYATSDRDAEFRRLVRISLPDGAETVAFDAGWDVEQVDVSPDGRTVAFTTNEDGISRLHLLDTATGRHRPVHGVAAGVLSGIDWREDGSEIGFSLQSAATPSDVYSLDVSSGELSRWTRSELGGLEFARLAEPERVQWTSFDGRAIRGLLYRPPESFTGPRPVIVNIHGGPEAQTRASFLGRGNYYLNELGAAIIYPNVRGSTGYGKTFTSLDNGLRRLDSVRDIGALFDWIATQPDLDAGRVMVTGGSYGGFMTLAVASMYPDRIRAAVDVVGISHLGTFLRNTESYRRDLRRVEYGDERDPELAAFFEETAPLTNAGRITKPLFVVQGANDPRVPRSEAEQIVERVRANGTPVWYLLAHNEGHGFAKKDNADFQFYATVLFVREFLLGD